jgi:hypothetical protein
MENAYTQHRLYADFLELRKDDQAFSALYDNTEEDFFTWALNYELDSDWE